LPGKGDPVFIFTAFHYHVPNDGIAAQGVVKKTLYHLAFFL
jgi:hypothetical protein